MGSALFHENMRLLDSFIDDLNDESVR